MSIAPIAFFCFNRPNELERTLKALANNKGASESHITFFCDGPRTEQEKLLTESVRSIAHNVKGFASVTVVERNINLGCKKSFVVGLQYMFERYENIIVIEDDVFCSPLTLEFLNEGLIRYKDSKNVFNISAWSPPDIATSAPQKYVYDLYTIPRFNCWGWASWRDRFENIDWDVQDYEQFKKSTELRKQYSSGGDDLPHLLDAQMHGKLDTWDVIVDYFRFKKKLVGINPIISYVTNIGMGCGTHTVNTTDKYDCNIKNALDVKKLRWVPSEVVNKKILKAYQKFYAIKKKISYKELVYTILHKIKLFNLTKKCYYLFFKRG